MESFPAWLLKFLTLWCLAPRPFRLWEKPEFSFILTFMRIPSSWNEESPEKPEKDAFSGVKIAFFRLKNP